MTQSEKFEEKARKRVKDEKQVLFRKKYKRD